MSTPQGPYGQQPGTPPPGQNPYAPQGGQPQQPGGPAYGQQPPQQTQPRQGYQPQPGYGGQPQQGYGGQPGYGQQQGHQPQQGYPQYAQPGYQQPGFDPMQQYAQAPGQLAELGARVAQGLLDWLVTYGVGLLVVILGAVLAGVGGANQSGGLVGFGVILYVLGFLAMFVLGLINQVFYAGSHNGQTMMMARRNMRIVKLDGSPVSRGDLALRWLLYLVIDGGIIGLIVVAASEKNQRLGDMAAKTVVVQQ